jgi:hypothetical protein
MIHIERGPSTTPTLQNASVHVDDQVNVREESQDQTQNRMPRDSPTFLGTAGIKRSLKLRCISKERSSLCQQAFLRNTVPTFR